MTKRGILYACFSIIVLLFLGAPSKCYGNSNNNEPKDIIGSINKTPLEIHVVIEQQVNNLEQKVKGLEQKANKIDKIEQRISEIKVESKASKLLNEVSEKNLKAPNMIWVIVLSIIAIVTTLIIAVAVYFFKDLRKDLKRDFETERDKLKDIEKELKELISRGIKQTKIAIDKELKQLENLTKEASDEYYRIIYNTYPRYAYNYWKSENYREAIQYSEKAVNYAEQKWGKEPDDPKNKERINILRGNLAYYYVDGNRKDMTGKAIDYAKMALETGINTNNISLIDNYLFVIMRFSKLPEDKQKWVQNYESYQDEINALASLPRTIKEEYKNYYDSLIS